MKKNYASFLILLFCMNIYANHYNKLSSHLIPTTNLQPKLVAFFVGLFGDDEAANLKQNIESINIIEATKSSFSAFAILNCPPDIIDNNEVGFCGATVDWTVPT
ncbi:MAG TPA: hypothetical protein VGA80_05075, partial [Flavobacteriaceae bacterium]